MLLHPCSSAPEKCNEQRHFYSEFWSILVSLLNVFKCAFVSWFWALSWFWSYLGYDVYMEHKKPGYSCLCIHDSHLSRFLIISVQLYVDFSLSQPLHSVICTSKVCSETWIRCLHATVSWFLLEYIQVIKPYPGFWNQGKVFTGAKCNQDTPKTMLRVAEQVDPKQPIQSRTKAPTTVNWKLGLK